MIFAFDSIDAFLHMGGYALYVWLAYGLSSLAFFGLVIFLRKKRQAALDLIDTDSQAASTKSAARYTIQSAEDDA